MIYHMTRGLKLTGIALAVLFLLVAGLVVYLKSLDFNDYKPQIQEAVLDASGRTLSIDGQLTLSVSLHPALVVEGVHLSNVKGGSRPNMVDIERLEVELRLWPLLLGNVHVERLILIRPDILLETLADGSANWTFAGASPEAPAEVEESEEQETPTSLPQVHHLMIRDARLSYRDAKTGRTQSLSLPKVQLWEEGDGSDAPLHLSVNGQFNKTSLKLEGKLGSVGALVDNEKLEVALRAAIADAQLQINGSVDKPLDAKGIALNIDLNAPDMAALAKLVDLPLETFPLRLKAMLKDSENGFDLSGLQVNIRNSDVTGDIRLALIQPRPRINAALQSKRFSLDDMLPAKKKSEAVPQRADKGSKAKATARKEPAERVFPAEPLDLKALKSVDADISWKAKQFLVAGMQMTDVDAKLGLAGGVLKLAPFKARLGGGSMNMTMTLRGDRPPARFDLVLTGRNIVSGKLLGSSGGKGEKPMMQGGSLNVDVSLNGKGASIAEIMGHSSGRIKLRMDKAKVKSDALNLVGGDVLMSLVGKLNPFAESKDYTALLCGVVHFRVQDGLMVTEDGIAFETDRMNILSEGEINLQDETLDLSVGTEPREGIGINVSNMVNVVRLGGTLAEPGIRVDAAKTGMATARVAGAIATGGLSLLGEGLFNRVMADSTPCQTALEMK